MLEDDLMRAYRTLHAADRSAESFGEMCIGVSIRELASSA